MYMDMYCCALSKNYWYTQTYTHLMIKLRLDLDIT